MHTNLHINSSRPRDTAYNNFGLLGTHTDKMGVKDQPTYDTYKRGFATSNGEGVGTAIARSTLSSFDSAGRATGSRDVLGFWTTYFTRWPTML